jgi:hypothetical protein
MSARKTYDCRYAPYIDIHVWGITRGHLLVWEIITCEEAIRAFMIWSGSLNDKNLMSHSSESVMNTSVKLLCCEFQTRARTHTRARAHTLSLSLSVYICLFRSKELRGTDTVLRHYNGIRGQDITVRYVTSMSVTMPTAAQQWARPEGDDSVFKVTPDLSNSCINITTPLPMRATYPTLI